MTESTRMIALGLVGGIWLMAAAWLAAFAARRARTAQGERDEGEALRALVASVPAAPLLVEAGAHFRADARLAAWLETEAGLSQGSFGGLDSIDRADAAALDVAVAESRATGSSFEQVLRVPASGRILQVCGAPAPPGLAARSVLLWFTDVTDSQQLMAARQAEIARLTTALNSLSALIEAAPFPIWHRGPDLRLAMVNSAYVAAVEAEDAMAVIGSGIELVDETDGRTTLSQAALVRERGEAVARTVPATIAGERRTMRVVEVPLGDAGVAGYAIDVEDREQARADLARFVRAQRDMLDRLSAGVAQFSRDRVLTFVNQPFARLFSLAGDFLADHPEFDRVIDRMREGGNLPEVRDFPEWKRERRGWFTSGLAAEEEDWLLPGGKHLRVVAQPLPDGGLLLIFEDRTEQVQLASARDTLLRVRSATFDNLFEAIGVFASDGRLHLWNHRFQALWEFEEEQLASHPRIDALVPHIAKKLKQRKDAALVRELVRSATVERKQRNGQISLLGDRDFEFAAVPLPDGNALFIMLDITDSRMIEAALRDRNEALQDADRLKTHFVSNMSYELRTPLTSIGGFAEMLAGGYAGDLPATAREYVDAITVSVAKLSSLIDTVLDLTQSEVGGLDLAADQIDVRSLCIEVAAGHADLARRKDIEIAVDVEPSAGDLCGDRRRLAQALDAVVKNALAYTGKEGRVLVHASGSARAVEIVVSDNGVGIDPADQARVFDRFHRTEEGIKAGSALGLGLPLARQLVEAHSGTVTLQSEPGAGTSVTFFVPRGL